jgi:hypothetical protein
VFGTKPSGNLAKALDRTQNGLSNPENTHVNMEEGVTIVGRFRAEPARIGTYEVFELNETCKASEPCLDIALETGSSFYEDHHVFKKIVVVNILLPEENEGNSERVNTMSAK